MIILTQEALSLRKVKEMMKNNAGTVYLVSVSGAKQYDQDAERWWDIGMTDTQFFQIVKVEGNELKILCV